MISKTRQNISWANLLDSLEPNIKRLRNTSTIKWETKISRKTSRTSPIRKLIKQKNSWTINPKMRKVSPEEPQEKPLEIIDKQETSLLRKLTKPNNFWVTRQKMLEALQEEFQEKHQETSDKQETMHHKRLMTLKIIFRRRQEMLRDWLKELQIKGKDCTIRPRDMYLRPLTTCQILPIVLQNQLKTSLQTSLQTLLDYCQTSQAEKEALWIRLKTSQGII